MEINYKKYKDILFKNIKNHLIKWFETEKENEISNSDVFRFLHSIKGTSGTINLGGLLQVSSALLEQVNESDTKIWTKQELRNFLSELVELCYEYEHYDHMQELSSIKKSGHPSQQAHLIQIIDDDVSMLILLKEELEKEGWMVLATSDPSKALSQYFDMHPDCVIIDVNMPKKNGFEILDSLEQNIRKRFVPTIMISIDEERETRIRSYKMGADDFIAKPIDIEEFIVKIRRHLERKEIFEQSVLVDELTKVYNRKFLQGEFKRLLGELKRSNEYFTMAILDIDHFKSVNDQYGHITGDHVLEEFAQFIQGQVRTGDTVVRYGGEEFIILFPRTTSEFAQNVLERTNEMFSKKVFSHKNHQFSVTFSAGVYTVTNSEEHLLDALNHADHSLYEAKANGRSRVEVAKSSGKELTKEKLYVSIVDDDAIIRTMLTKMMNSLSLDSFEIEIQSFENGSKFFESKRYEQPGGHFVILDGIMPVMDGLEVLQKLRALHNSDDYTILMLTGRKAESDIARALTYGADDYLTKPFSITELQARIKRLIQRMY